MKRRPAEIGKRFGKLTVIGDGVRKNGKSHWLFKCDCGKEKHIYFHAITSGRNVSCGCHRLTIHSSHGMSKSALYKVWISAKQRCSNPKGKAYKYYGGRGIEVKWSTFEVFYTDMYPTYKKGLTLDRIDTNGDYCKENCRWVTRAEQMLNTRRNRYVEHKNESKAISEWAVELGINYRTLNNRINRGWKVEDAFTRKVQPRHARG